MSKRNRNKAKGQEDQVLEAPAVEAPAEGTMSTEAAAPAEGTSEATGTEAAAFTEKPKPFLGKYENAIFKSGGAIPSTFKYRDTPLFAADKPQERVSKDGVTGRPSVKLRIYNMVFANPGIPGEQLVQLMQQQDWTGHPSAYTKTGEVCINWCVDYVTARLRPKVNHLTTTAPEFGEEYEALEDSAE